MAEKKTVQSVVLRDPNTGSTENIYCPLTTSDNILMEYQRTETLTDFINSVAHPKLAHISWISSDMSPSLLDDEGILSGQNIYDITGKKMQDFGLKNLAPNIFNTNNAFFYNKYSKTFLRFYTSSTSLGNTVTYEIYKYNGLDARPELITDDFRSNYYPSMFQYPVDSSDPRRASTRTLPRFEELFSVFCNPSTGGYAVHCAFVGSRSQRDTFTLLDPTYKDVQLHSLGRNENSSYIYSKNFFLMPNSPQSNFRVWKKSSQYGATTANYTKGTHTYSAGNIQITTSSDGQTGNSLGDVMQNSYMPKREIQCIQYTPTFVTLMGVKQYDARLYFESFSCSGTGSSRLNNTCTWGYHSNKSYIIGAGYNESLKKATISDYVIYKDHIYLLMDNYKLHRILIKDRQLSSTVSISDALEYDSVFGEVELPFKVSAIEVCDSGVLCKNGIDGFFGSYFYNWDKRANRKIYYHDIITSVEGFYPPGKYNWNHYPKTENYSPTQDLKFEDVQRSHTAKREKNILVFFQSFGYPTKGNIKVVNGPTAYVQQHQQHLNSYQFDTDTPIMITNDDSHRTKMSTELAYQGISSDGSNDTKRFDSTVIDIEINL